jgi:hypothetical protein
MLFFDNKLLLKYSGVTGALLAGDRIIGDLTSSYAAYAATRDAAYTAYVDARYASEAAYTTGDVNATEAAYAAEEAARVVYDAASAACAAHYAEGNTVYTVARENGKFFKPFKSSSDAVFSAFSIISDPILLTLLALDEIVSFIVSSLKSIYNFVSSNPDAAKESGEEAVSHLLGAVKALLTAAVSPVVNAVDFVGSCVATSKITNLSGDGQDTFNAEENFDSPRV